MTKNSETDLSKEEKELIRDLCPLKEMKIPYSAITLAELKMFTEVICDADTQSVIVRW